MVCAALTIFFILLLTGFVAFGEMLNEKYQWVDTSEDDSIEYQKPEQKKVKTDRKVG